MDQSNVYGKTDAGIAEVKQRSNLLDQRCRNLLVLIDGKTPAQKIIARLATLSMSGEHLQRLIDLGLVASVTSVAAPVQVRSATRPGAPPPATPFPAAPSPAAAPPAAALALGTGRPAPPTAATPVLDHSAKKFIEVGNFLNQTAKDLMGLFAAIGFQQKVAKASSVEDFWNLRQVMHEAITKSKGEPVARAMVAELERLISA